MTLLNCPSWFLYGAIVAFCLLDRTLLVFTCYNVKKNESVSPSVNLYVVLKVFISSKGGLLQTLTSWFLLPFYLVLSISPISITQSLALSSKITHSALDSTLPKHPCRFFFPFEWFCRVFSTCGAYIEGQRYLLFFSLKFLSFSFRL